MANTLQKKMQKRDKSISEKIEKQDELAVFDEKGRFKKPKKSYPKWPFITAGIFLLLFLSIYVPAWITGGNSIDNPLVKDYDTTAIQSAQNYIKSHPNDDMDNDRVINSMEGMNGTSPRKPDSDGDGVSDYAEVYVTITDPRKADNYLDTQMKKKLQEEGKDYSAPFKVGNIVLWADNLSSRAHGSVVKTINGFRFCKFTGWVEFPLKNVYAYKYENGEHKLLKYKETENAWKIDGDYEVELFDHELEPVHRFNFLNTVKYIENDFLGNALSLILPKNSKFIACKEVMREDTYVDTSDLLSNNIVKIEFDANDDARFGRNFNLLSDLANLYGQLNEGRCVAVNLMSSSYGSTHVTCYGYDARGNLLIANDETLEPIGRIYIEERAEQYMDESGEITLREWYEWFGAGYDSKNGDIINFFAVGRIPSDDNAVNVHPEPITAMSGDEITFTTEAGGEVESYHWVMSGEGNSWVEIEENETVNTPSLTLKAGIKQDGTRYKCLVTFKNKDVKESNPATLTVYGITAEPSDITITADENATFKIGGKGIKTYLWQISKDGKKWEDVKDNKTVNTAEFVIKGTEALNNYQVKCHITFENSIEKDSKAVKLTVNKKAAQEEKPEEKKEEQQNNG